MGSPTRHSRCGDGAVTPGGRNLCRAHAVRPYELRLYLDFRALLLVWWRATHPSAQKWSLISNTLKDKVAIVTGAGRGIGRAIAKALAGEGATVALAARSRADLEAVKAEIEEIGGAALVVPTDVTQEAAVKNLVAVMRGESGRLDILINNAGIASRRPLAQTTTDEWDRMMAVNARGPFLLCREALPLLKASAEGVIINISSVVGVKGYCCQAAYAASKHALMGMTKVLAQELKGEGIRVHAVCPGGVATGMASEMRPDLDASALMAPEEVADIVLFLLTRTGNAVIDEVHVRRAQSDPWF